MRKPKHDLEIDDISDYDLSLIKSKAVSDFVNTKEARQVPLILNSFLRYLISKGYEIRKVEEDDKPTD